MRPLAPLLAISLLWAGPALGHGGGAGGAQLPKDAPAVTPDGEKAKAELDGLAKDEAKQKVAGEATGKGRAALGRAHGASLAGDTVSAKLLSRVALAWASAAAAAVRASETEAKAGAAETKTIELKEKLVRAKALLAENEARRLQLAAEVQKLEDAAKSSDKAPAKPTKGADKSPAKGSKGAPEKGAPPDKPKDLPAKKSGRP